MNSLSIFLTTAISRSLILMNGLTNGDSTNQVRDRQGRALAKKLSDHYGPGWDVVVLKSYFHLQFHLFDLVVNEGKTIPGEVWECLDLQWSMIDAIHDSEDSNPVGSG